MPNSKGRIARKEVKAYKCPVCKTPIKTSKRSASGDLPTCSIKCGYKWREIKRSQKQVFVKPDSAIDRFIL